MGMENPEIAEWLGLKTHTIKRYVRVIGEKVGIYYGWGIYRVRLAMYLHRRRRELGIRCTCDRECPSL